MFSLPSARTDIRDPWGCRGRCVDGLARGRCACWFTLWGVGESPPLGESAGWVPGYIACVRGLTVLFLLIVGFVVPSAALAGEGLPGGGLVSAASSSGSGSVAGVVSPAVEAAAPVVEPVAAVIAPAVAPAVSVPEPVAATVEPVAETTAPAIEVVAETVGPAAEILEPAIDAAAPVVESAAGLVEPVVTGAAATLESAAPANPVRSDPSSAPPAASAVPDVQSGEPAPVFTWAAPMVPASVLAGAVPPMQPLFAEATRPPVEAPAVYLGERDLVVLPGPGLEVQAESSAWPLPVLSAGLRPSGMSVPDDPAADGVVAHAVGVAGAGAALIWLALAAGLVLCIPALFCRIVPSRMVPQPLLLRLSLERPG
jgi:hypothetical protein